MATEFSREQVDVICAVEQLWWQTGSLPTHEKVSELTGVSVRTVERYFKDETVRESLLKRGVDLTPERSSALLTLPQLNLANMLLNLHDNRSVREKLNEAGVTSQQYRAWTRSPAFCSYLTQRGEQLFASSDHEAYVSLLGAVRGGDSKALQLFFEMRGIYNPKMQVDINVDVVMVRVVEVIAKHVRDPEVLQAIAQDLELIDIGTANTPVGGRVNVPMPILDVPVREMLPIESII